MPHYRGLQKTAHISSGENWFCTAAANRFGSPREVALLWNQGFRKYNCNKSGNKKCSIALKKNTS